jgi:hypothetical protein
MCPTSAAESLINEGWITQNPPLTIKQVSALLRKSEIVDLLGLAASNKLVKKSALLEELEHIYSEMVPLIKWFDQSGECIYQVNVSSVCERFRLMFFGNMKQDWSQFVLSELGIYRYEKVEFSLFSRPFHARQEIDEYLHLHRCHERFKQGQNIDEILSVISPTSHLNSWVDYRRDKLFFRIAQQYERGGELQRARDLYQRCNYPGARIRMIRVCEKRGEHEAAFEHANIALSAPESEEEQQVLRRMLPRLRRKLGHRNSEEITQPPVNEFKVVLPYPSLSISVEIAAQLHLSCEQTTVAYVENTLINSLFGLLCWPAIFAALPGAFFHPFHSGPADLHRPDFVQRRREIFAACLASLDNESYHQVIIDNFHLKWGIQCPFVFWSAIDEALLKLALHCIPALHLKKYFERILFDISSNCSGFPDLIQFWPQEKRYLLVEVKGPGDRLQDNQIRWIHYCNLHAIPVAVCYVQWLEQTS